MRRVVLSAMLLAAAGVPVWASGAPADTAPSPEEIIQRFAAKEAEFAKARENYTYRQTVQIVELDPPGGKFELVEDVIFSRERKRTEKVVRAPVPTLRNLILTPEDEQDLRNVQPFVLTTTEIPEYDIRYLGKQKADEIPCHVFAVKPKKMVQGKRYFEGQIWVDDRDLQIVKTDGKGVGLLKKGSDNQFPRFETYREQVDGKYWFPTYTIANDTLHFQNSSQKIKMVVKYQDYKYFTGEATVKYGDVVNENAPPKPPENKAPEKK